MLPFIIIAVKNERVMIGGFFADQYHYDVENTRHSVQQCEATSMLSTFLFVKPH